jgi:hypothetical protein
MEGPAVMIAKHAAGGERLAKGFALEIPAGFGSRKSRKSRKPEVRSVSCGSMA